MTSDQSPMSWEAAVVWLRGEPRFQRLVLDAYYDDPLLGAAERYRKGEEWQEILKLAGPAVASMSVLDVGAGRGISSYAFAKAGARVSALEPDPSDIVGAGAIRSLAHEAKLSISVVADKSEKLPFADSSFDIVFARAVLHHADDLPAACSEFFRVLKKGGQLIGVREHVISRPDDLPAFLKIHPLHSLYGGENAYLLSYYEQTIQAAGFELLKTLAPLESAINYAPYTRETLIEGVAHRIPISIVAKPFARLLKSINWLGNIALRIASRFDHRPGRLYSFVARRPL
jgi:SAM-dependent methyltransferase